MKKNLLSLVLTAVCSLLYAQQDVTVSTGAGYADDVYYSLENGVVKTSARNAWDLAFDVSARGADVLINEANGVNLYLYGTEASEYATVDTTGFLWAARYNADTAWNAGAFGEWYTYNFITHTLAGNNVYVLQLADGSYKKIIVESLIGGTYTFKYADLDGENEVSSTIKKVDYANRNFAYYAIGTDQAHDLEPDNATWDIVFTRYVVDFGFHTTGVSGILSNAGVQSEEIVGHVDEAAYTEENLSDDISIVGYDWKSYDYRTGIYSIDDSLTYYVKSLDGEVYKLVFTGFGGSATGDYEFTQEILTTTNVVEGESSNNVAIYPNPATDVVNIVANAGENVTIVSVTGAVVYEGNDVQIDVTGFDAGVYVVNVGGLRQKLIVK
ncbi:MAG: T9SS type A sorting domain-containing protein [Cytophagales bacterium]|nr:T9SS type A sorting domain-containing protein [Cytophagales bacterium]